MDVTTTSFMLRVFFKVSSTSFSSKSSRLLCSICVTDGCRSISMVFVVGCGNGDENVVTDSISLMGGVLENLSSLSRGFSKIVKDTGSEGGGGSVET